MQQRLYQSAITALCAPPGQSRLFWSALRQAIRQVKGDDLKHEQFRQDLHYLYLVTAVHDHIKHGTSQLGNSTDEVADSAIQNAESMTTEAMYSSVNSSISSALKHTAGVFHDICLKATPAAADTPQLASNPSQSSPSTPLYGAAASESSQASDSAHSLATSRGENDPEGREVAAEPQLGRSHRNSSASDAVRAADAEADPEEAPYEPPRWLAGRKNLTNKERRNAELQELTPLAAADGLSAEDVRQAAFEALGFRLDVRKSGIEHAAAGDGVWLQGSAEIGSVVAIHPGVVYSQAYHTEMKGFPNITTGNDAILARYDNTLVDAKPWGRGQARAGAEWVSEGQPLDRALNLVDGRHPLAAAPYINHPPPDVKPNVLLAPFDLVLSEEERHLRCFLPYVSCASTLASILGDRVTGLVLVARRRLEDEELFMDYRLNPNHARPQWYRPVDALAEQRRWA